MKRTILYIIISIFFSLNCLALSFAQNQEQLTITTYYPSPSGSYNELDVAKWLKLNRTGPATPVPPFYSTGELRFWTPTPAPDGSGWSLYNRGPDSIPVGDKNKLYLDYFDGTNWHGPDLVVQHITTAGTPPLNFPRVGIGITNPTAMFELSHDGSTPDFTVGGGSCPKCIDVGIGTDNPNSRLHIRGDSDRNGQSVITLEPTDDGAGNRGGSGIHFASPPYHTADIAFTGGNPGDIGNLNISVGGPDDRRLNLSAATTELYMGYTKVVGVRPNLFVGDYTVPYNPNPPTYVLRVSRDGTVNDLVVDTATGRVGIGTASPQAGLDISLGSSLPVPLDLPGLRVMSKSAGLGAGIQFVNTSGMPPWQTYGIYAGSDSIWHFTDVNSGTDSIAISSSGNVGIGTAPSKNTILTMDSKKIPKQTADCYLLFNSLTGEVYRDTQPVNSPGSSARKYKKNIQALSDNFQKILKANPKSFVYKRDGEKGIGYIAEDFDETGLKDLVVYDKDGKPDGIKYDKIPVYILEIVKEQQKRIEALEAKVNNLEAKAKK